MSPVPTVVLVHGAFAESSSWADVAGRLLDQGFPTRAFAVPLRSVATDAALLGRLVSTIDGPVVLVGHSYGGAVITNLDPATGDIAALVYVAGFALDQNGGSRGTVVFIPGWPLSSTTFEYQLQFLADHGYRAIALDMRGFGRSDAPYGPYGYDVWAQDILTVLKALSLRGVTLVGHSMGAAIAIRHAARYGSRVNRLILAEAPAPRFAYGPQSAQLAAALNGLITGYAANRAATAKALTGGFFSTHTDVEGDPFLQFFQRQALDQASLPASRAGLLALRDTDLTGDLPRISVPTRVFHAVNDQVVPFDHGQALAKGIRGATLVWFATAGHGAYVDEPDKFNREVLSFVS